MTSSFCAAELLFTAQRLMHQSRPGLLAAQLREGTSKGADQIRIFAW
jgi:hypothetical protein